MKNMCQICSRPNRLEIDREIVRGGNLSKLAKENGVSYNSMWYHSTNHVSRQLVQAARQKDLMKSMDIIGDVEGLIDRTKRILDEVEEKKHHGTALQAIRELRGHYELLSKIAFALHQARLAELEHAQMNQEAEQEALNQEAMTKLRILTDDELRLYQRLTKKVAEQDKSIDIEIPRPTVFTRKKPAKKPAPEPEPDQPAPLDDLFKKRQVKIMRTRD